MTRLDLVRCDQCGKQIDRAVAVDWIATEYVAFETFGTRYRGEFCGPDCLVQYFAQYAVRQEEQR